MGVTNRRRQNERAALGLATTGRTFVEEVEICIEQSRRARKKARRERIERSRTYGKLQTIADVMDKYHLDAIVGLIPVVGDFIGVFTLVPFLYVSIRYIRSIPLCLAIIANTLLDVLVGLIPFYIGDILDFFLRTNSRNLALIIGFVEDDGEVIRAVNRRAWSLGLIILVYIIMIAAMIFLAIMFVSWVISMFAIVVSQIPTLWHYCFG